MKGFLGTCRKELTLAHTLPIGQTFRWRPDPAPSPSPSPPASAPGSPARSPARTSPRPSPTPPTSFTGVLGHRVYRLRHVGEDVEYHVLGELPSPSAPPPLAQLRAYFQLDVSLVQLTEFWSERDPEHYKPAVERYPGVRMLLQDPTETLFSFLCSQNNHISRIHGMVEALCSNYGTEIMPSYYAFPTVEQIARGATEERLRELGFGCVPRRTIARWAGPAGLGWDMTATHP